VIEIEHRALRALEQDRAAVGHRARESHGHVGNPRAEARAELARLREHLCPVEGLVAGQPVPPRDAVADLFFQRGVVGEVAHAQPTPARLVFISRADAARRRADHARAEARLAEPVDVPVVREDEVRAVGHHEAPVDGDARGRQFPDLVEEGLQIDDDAIPDDARDAGVQDA
jgi:hypothetical protein